MYIATRRARLEAREAGFLVCLNFEITIVIFNVLNQPFSHKAKAKNSYH